MERLLQAQTHNAVQSLQDSLGHKYLETLSVHDDRSDVHKADLLEQKEHRDAVKFEQLYWETIPEGGRVSFDLPFSFLLMKPCQHCIFSGTYPSQFSARSSKRCYFQEEKKAGKSECQIHASYTRHRVHQDSHI